MNNRLTSRLVPEKAGTASADAGTHPATEALYKMAQFGRTLKHATHVLEKLMQTASSMHQHLTLSHWLVLVRLSSTVTCKQMELRTDTKITAAHLTRLVDDLAREGMVRRHRSSSDRRQILLSPTEHGKRVAMGLLASLKELTGPPQLSAMEQLCELLGRFVLLADGREREQDLAHKAASCTSSA